jgi:hypothetical protein
MIRIRITPGAYPALSGSLPRGTVGVERDRAGKGGYHSPCTR